MDRVIRHATACEGGCLKESGGDTTPSAYIKHWRAALAAPVALQARVVSASFGINLYTLDPKLREQTAQILAAHAHPGIDGDTVRFEIEAQPALLQALVEAGHHPWRFLEPESSCIDASWAAYQPTPCVGIEPVVSVYVVPPENNWEPEYWFQVENGAVINGGWAYSTVSKLIDIFARPSEAAHPGSAEDVIRRIRAKVKSAQQLASFEPICIDARVNCASYELGIDRELTEKLGQQGEDNIATTLGAVLSAGALYQLRSLPDRMVRFPDRVVPLGGGGAQQQLALAA